MKDNVQVPGVAWWILAGILIPVVQAWLMQAFPESPFLWVALAALGVLTVLGGIILAYTDKALPESVIVLGSVAVGALAGMVAPTSR